jgi:hypothetical protein
MATLTNSVMNVNLTTPAGNRFIYLDEDDFNGSAGEGQFTIGYGADRIPVYDTLKRAATFVEVLLTEGTGGTTDSYTILLYINPVIKVPRVRDNFYINALGMPLAELDSINSVETNPTPIQITATNGATVTWSGTFESIHDIDIDGLVTGSGTIGNFTILIK